MRYSKQDLKKAESNATKAAVMMASPKCCSGKATKTPAAHRLKRQNLSMVLSYRSPSTVSTLSLYLSAFSLPFPPFICHFKAHQGMHSAQRTCPKFSCRTPASPRRRKAIPTPGTKKPYSKGLNRNISIHTVFLAKQKER